MLAVLYDWAFYPDLWMQILFAFWFPGKIFLCTDCELLRQQLQFFCSAGLTVIIPVLYSLVNWPVLLSQLGHILEGCLEVFGKVPDTVN